MSPIFDYQSADGELLVPLTGFLTVWERLSGLSFYVFLAFYKKKRYNNVNHYM